MKVELDVRDVHYVLGKALEAAKNEHAHSVAQFLEMARAAQGTAPSSRAGMWWDVTRRWARWVIEDHHRIVRIQMVMKAVR